MLINADISWYNLGRNIDELMHRFKASIYMSRKTNEACPSKWKDEGDICLHLEAHANADSRTTEVR